MITLIALGLALVAGGVLVLVVERLLGRREARRRVRVEFHRAAIRAAFRAAHAAQERRVQEMFAERTERGWTS